MSFFRLFKKYRNKREKDIADLISYIFGVSHRNIELYIVALRHKSASKNLYTNNALSNERLEFLGDAVLDAIVADYLYSKYEDAEEGELTKMKSRIVSRTNLNGMAQQMGIPDLLETDAQAAQAKASISGNALEAIFGALYSDLGYPATYKAVIKVLDKYADMNTLEYQEADFKSRLFETAHKQKAELVFKTQPLSNSSGDKSFESLVLFNDVKIGKGVGTSKKRAEQEAAKAALTNLNLK